MLEKLKESAKIAGWLTLGVTAIAVEKTVDGVKAIKEEVDNDVPQELVRYHCRIIRNSIKNITKFKSKCSEPLHDHHDGCPVCDMPS